MITFAFQKWFVIGKNFYSNFIPFTLVCLMFMTKPLCAQFYNGTNVGFGKNRVQYDDFDWKYYRFSKLETYFYEAGEELAIYTAKVAGAEIARQEYLFEYELKEKIQFVIYNKQSHFKQSNVGLSLENGDLGGINRILGSKVFLFFNGNHDDFFTQIKEGVAHVLVNQQIYGSNWRQVLKNSNLITLPNWYEQGLTSYISKKWSPSIEAEVKDGISSGKYEHFNRLSDQEAIIAGHSIWAYIVDTYGEAVIPNILYMTRVTQNVEKGFLYVLGVPMKKLTSDWLSYYEGVHESQEGVAEDIYEKFERIKTKKRRDYREFRMSPDGKSFSYVTDQFGQYKVYIYYLQEDKKYKIYKREFKLDRLNDASYPVTAWHPSSEILAFITEEKGFLLINYFDITTGAISTKEIFNMEKVLSMSYAKNGKEMVFSGVYKGQSDLYLYYVGSNSQKKITNDLFDDLEPRFIENSDKIVFTSNRTTDSLGYQPTNKELFMNKRDVWMIDYKSSVGRLTRITNTSNVSEQYPSGVDSMIYYIGEGKDYGYKRYQAVKDSFITHIDTTIHYHHFYDITPDKQDVNIGLKEQYLDDRGNYTEVVVDKYKYHLLSKKVQDTATIVEKPVSSITSNTADSSFSAKENSYRLLKVVSHNEESGNEVLDINQYTFNNEKPRDSLVLPKTKRRELVVIPYPDKEFKLPNRRNYNLSFFNDNSSINLSNSFVNAEYQLFNGGPYVNPGIGGVMKLGIMDLFEDYKVFGGVRIGSGPSEYFMTLQDFHKRLDKEYTFSRTTTNYSDGSNVLQVATNRINYSLKYPFSEVSSVRGTATIRNDFSVFKATDINTLNTEKSNEYRGILKLAYVFDNTRKRSLNIYYGTRAKLFGEYYQEFFNPISGERNGNMQVVGIDVRHSKKISREFIWVNRFAASASFGREKLIYYLGGVDNWMNLSSRPMFDNAEDIDFSIPYKYQALAANLRGFAQNIRRGTNFAVINSELRLPIFKYFISRPIRSSLIRNFQVVGFMDAGTAWNGLTPYSDDNRVNVDFISDGPISVTLFRTSDPIVAGYGYGFRTTILGYFVRADWAWGVEDGIRSAKPRLYLSLSLDI